MKFDKFTLKAQEALATAQQIAMAKSHTVLSPLHLLSAICSDDVGIAVMILKKAGANIPRIKEMIDSFIIGKTDTAAEIHRRLMPLIKTLFVVSNPIPIKYALNHIGFEVGKPRPPLYEPDEKTAALIRETLKNYKIDLPV